MTCAYPRLLLLFPSVPRTLCCPFHSNVLCSSSSIFTAFPRTKISRSEFKKIIITHISILVRLHFVHQACMIPEYIITCWEMSACLTFFLLLTYFSLALYICFLVGTTGKIDEHTRLILSYISPPLSLSLSLPSLSSASKKKA